MKAISIEFCSCKQWQDKTVWFRATRQQDAREWAKGDGNIHQAVPSSVAETDQECEMQVLQGRRMDHQGPLCDRFYQSHQHTHQILTKW